MAADEDTSVFAPISLSPVDWLLIICERTQPSTAVAALHSPQTAAKWLYLQGRDGH